MPRQNRRFRPNRLQPEHRRPHGLEKPGRPGGGNRPHNQPRNRSNNWMLERTGLKGRLGEDTSGVGHETDSNASATASTSETVSEKASASETVVDSAVSGSKDDVSGANSVDRTEEETTHYRDAKAIDISHWSGEPSQEDVAAWEEWGVEHAIVGTQRQATTQAQLDILQGNGISTDAYVYLYFNRDMITQVDTALDRIEGHTCGVLWLDAEDRASAEGQTSSQLVSLLQVAVDTAESEFAARDLDMEVGIYTSWGFWTDVMENSEDFSDLPLWYAHWDKEANFDDWADLPFGGWESENLRGKQYEGDTYIQGADPIVDLNHMRIPEDEPDALADGSGETMDQTTIKAMLQSIVAGPVAGV